MRKVFMALLAVGVMGVACVAGGCAAISALTYKVTGDPKSPAEYKPKNVLTLVLVENYQNPDQYRGTASQLERDIATELTENKVTQIVPVAKLEDLRSEDAVAYRKMDVRAIGKAVGARQVIYVNLVKFSAQTPIGSTEQSGRAEARVRVMDVGTGRTLWPLDNLEGREIHYETKHEEAVDFSSAEAVHDQISQSLADRIARLFYAAAEAENEVGPKSR